MQSEVFFIWLGTIAVAVLFGWGMLRAGIGDVPGARSNHIDVTPTGGGVALWAALGAGIYAASVLIPMGEAAELRQASRILSLIAAAGLLGLVDDVFNLSARVKFLLIGILCGLAAVACGLLTELPWGDKSIMLAPWAAFLGAVLWMFVVTNIVNFMDGSNGLIIGNMSIACAGLAFVTQFISGPTPNLILSVLSAALFGLGYYNFRTKAKLFMGDAGSLMTGFTYGALTLWIASQSEASYVNAVYIGPVLVLPLLTDGLLTMLTRAVRREPLLSAHKDHLYQRLIATGSLHLTVAFVYMSVSALLILYALIMTRMHLTRSPMFLVWPVIILTIVYYWAGYRLTAKPRMRDDD